MFVQAWAHGSVGRWWVQGKKCIGRTGTDAGRAETAVYVVDSADETLLVIVVENLEARMDGVATLNVECGGVGPWRYLA